MKGDKMAKRSSFGSIMRKRLSNITKSLPQPKSPSFPEKLTSENVFAKEYIDHFVKEKMALVKLIQGKNKIIELSEIEIQNLRTCLQKMQLQNWNLVQTNCHMLAGKEKVNIQKAKVQEPGVVTKENKIHEDTKPCNASRRHLSRSRSLGSSTISQQLAEKEAAASKRRCMRRLSSSWRSRREPTVNLFEIDDVPDAFPSKGPIHEVGPRLLTSSSDGASTDGSRISELEAEARRTSFSRPLRKAAEKIQSYTERPINVKMRRSE